MFFLSAFVTQWFKKGRLLFIIYQTSCKSLRTFTTETPSHRVLIFFSQCLGVSVVKKGLNAIYCLLMQEVW